MRGEGGAQGTHTGRTRKPSWNPGPPFCSEVKVRSVAPATNDGTRADTMLLCLFWAIIPKKTDFSTFASVLSQSGVPAEPASPP